MIFARRSGNSWFIAGINGTAEPMPLTLDLKPFKAFHHRLAVVEGADPAMQVAVRHEAEADHWNAMIAPRGGFILRLDK